MKAADIRMKTEKEIGDEINKLRRELMNLRFQKSTSELSNTSRFRFVRKEIAKLKTILNEKKA